MNSFVGGASILIGVIAALIGVFLRVRARKQLAWEAVPGLVRTASYSWDSEYYVPRIEYTYSYRENEFRGAKVRSLLVMANWQGPARRLVEKYPVGMPVTVFVNPADPRQAVLERGGDPKFLPLMLFISAIFVITGWAFLSGGVS